MERSSCRGGAGAAGQKSYWERFHGDVTVGLKLHASGKKIGARGRALQQRFWGAPRMTTTTMAGPQIPKDFRTVIVAASVGNVIEWYDFYIFGSLAAVLSVKFFEQSHPVAALLSTIALFTAGFLIRPLGAFLFGWMGDRIGRKYTFLVTLSGMGLGTRAIGLIPTFTSIGLTAA